jgi:hypothetical protein
MLKTYFLIEIGNIMSCFSSRRIMLYSRGAQLKSHGGPEIFVVVMFKGPKLVVSSPSSQEHFKLISIGLSINDLTVVGGRGSRIL